MSLSKFISGILICILVSYLVFFLVKLVLPVEPYFDLVHYSVLFFVITASVVYFLAHMASNSQAKNPFIYIIMGNVFFKLVAAFVLVYLYADATKPNDTYFIFPFLWVYLIFLIFETIFLSKQARNSK